MSRLIVKNLPPYVTSTQLKEHFTQKGRPEGTITDVKVAQKPDGTTRRFGFVGFKSEEEARKAREWFDKTFLGSARLNVDVVEKDVKEAPVPRPNKKRRTRDDVGIVENQFQDVKRSRPADADPGPSNKCAKTDKKEKEMREYMQVMQPRTKKDRTWANDDGLPVASTPPSTSKKGKGKASKDAEDVTEQSAEVLDDLEWMKRRMTKNIDEEKVFEQDEEPEGEESTKLDETDQNTTEAVVAMDESSPVRSILRTGRLFLRNLSYTCLQSDLEALFSPYGALAQVHIPLDPATKTSKGLAFVTFSDPPCAVKAYEELDKASFQGRLLHILPAAEKRGTGVKDIEEVPGKSVKSEREKKRKENATKEFNWSMLYMNSDAVASSIADRMNIPKAEILNPESADGDHTSAAVKLALAETHIIQETKTYLESEGIDINAFAMLVSSDRNIRTRRSDTCILVKNIPYGTTAEQIRDMFEPHGELDRVLVPPAGTIAVVDFVHPDEAAKAFRAVAYRRLGSSVVYLEKAPLGIFSGTRSGGNAKATAEAYATHGANSSIGGGNVVPDGDAEEPESEVAPGATLYIKNLSFATTSERLINVFRHLPSFVFARVQTKPDPKRPVVPGQPAPRLSMGFGFVGFATPDAARKALKSMDGFVLDGHTLAVKFAGRGADADEQTGTKDKVAAKAKSTKMIVKNVPFEANKKELRALFGAHGQLKSVRLPKKFDSRARGFAFLDFTSRHEAENAYAALRHTHLLGRHLVLEWAKDSAQDIEALRKKAGVGYGDGAELPGKKRKLQLQEDDGSDDGV